MKSSRLSLFVILLLALFAGITWGANRQIQGQSHPNWTSFSSSDYGVSLLYDTLRHMRYRVNILYQPIQENVSINDVVLIIQPTNPRPNDEMAMEILTWVRRGGRLIYLENSQPTIMDRVLLGEHFTSVGGLNWYRIGMGEVVTGRANVVANINLMEDPTYGENIVMVLSVWEPDRIYFAEYYHGFRRSDSAFNQMPMWLQFAAFQVIIAAAVLVWHLGKRFGSPIPLYEEIEREENEQILTLARLYKQADKR